MKTQEGHTIVDTLYNAYCHNQPISKEDFPKGICISEAYDIQHQLTEKKANDLNDNLVGYKISLTSEETQQLFDATTPLYGALTKASISDGTIYLDNMLAPLIEIELIFMVNEDLSTQDNQQTILQKTSIAPGLEIPDSRFTDWFPKLSLGQVIADSAVAGKVVIGESVEGLTVDKLEQITAELTLEGEPIAEGQSTEVLGNPVHSIKWLIDELAKSGRVLEKGMIISSGTFILPQVLQEGTYTVRFGDIGEVTLQVL